MQRPLIAIWEGTCGILRDPVHDGRLTRRKMGGSMDWRAVADCRGSRLWAAIDGRVGPCR